MTKAKRIASIILTTGLLSCLSGSQQVDQLIGFTPNVVQVPQSLQITISSPSTANKRVGYSTKITGNCSLAGAGVKVLGPSGQTLGLTACQVGGVWTVEITLDSITTLGSFAISAYLYQNNEESGAATVTLYKDNTACDSSTARSGTFGNISTGGDGVGTPYTICTAVQFGNIRSYLTSHFDIKNDLLFSGSPFTTIAGTYSGTLNGNEFSIDSMTISAPTSNEIGIFTYIGNGAVIKNFTINTIRVTGAVRAAGLAGRAVGAAGATVENVHMTGATIAASGLGSAGFVAYLDNGASLTVTNVSFSGSISSAGYVGSVLGYTHGTSAAFTVTDATATGSIQSGGAYTAGIAGFLDLTNSTISSVTVTDMNITSTAGDYTGGIIGNSDGVDITDATYSGTINATGSYVGGIAGRFIGTKLWDVSATATLGVDTTSGARTYFGGIVGYAVSTTAELKNCSSKISISITGANTGSYLGGLAGRFSGALVDNCTVSGLTAGTAAVITTNTGDGATTGGQYHGGVFGHVYAAEGDSLTVSSITSDATVSVTSANANVYAGGFVGYVSTVEGIAGPGNVDFSSITANGSLTSTNYFAGGFAGAMYSGRHNSTISSTDINVNVSVTNAPLGPAARHSGYVGGFVGQASTRQSAENYPASGGNQMTRVVSTGHVVSNGPYTGGLIGYFYGGRSNFGGSSSTITNSSASGNVAVTFSTTAVSYVGGLIGRAYAETTCSLTITSDATPSTTKATGNVTSVRDFVGGLIGDTAIAGTGAIAINNAFATGAVTVDVTATFDVYVGGLTGRLNATTTTVANSYATGAVNVTTSGAGSITNAYTGGLVGYAYGAISNSYATGVVAVTSVGTRRFVGGLAGRSSANIQNSFATGHTQGGQDVGGLVGYFRVGLISNSFAAGNVTAAFQAGGLVGDYQAGGAVGGISESYAVGSLTREGGSVQTTRFGQIVGYCGADNYVATSYYNSDTSLIDPAIVTPMALCNTTTARNLSTAQMLVSGNYAGWDFAGTNADSWRMPVGFSANGSLYTFPVLYGLEN